MRIIGVFIISCLLSSATVVGQAALTQESQKIITIEGAAARNSNATSVGLGASGLLAGTVELGVNAGLVEDNWFLGAEGKLYPAGFRGGAPVLGWSLLAGLQHSSHKVQYSGRTTLMDVDLFYYGGELFATPKISSMTYIQPLLRVARIHDAGSNFEGLTTAFDALLSYFLVKHNSSAWRFTFGVGVTTNETPATLLLSVAWLKWRSISDQF